MNSLGRFGVGVSNCRSVTDVVTSVIEAEHLGAEIAFIAEDVNCRDAFELAALSAAGTERIRLATGVVNPYTRNPTSLAMAIATLDEISQGRATLGLGTSSPSLIEDQMGIAMGRQVRVMREAAEVVRGLLSGETISYAGQRFTYREAQLEARPVQSRIPIFFAAMGPLMLRLAGRMADGVLLNVGASTDYVRWAVHQIQKGAEEQGRDPGQITMAAWLSVYVGPDPETDLQRAREWLATMLSIPRQGEVLLTQTGLDTSILADIRRHYRAYPHSGDKVAAARYIPTEVVQQLTLVGTADEVHRRLGEYRAAGVQIPVMGLSAIQALNA